MYLPFILVEEEFKMLQLLYVCYSVLGKMTFRLQRARHNGYLWIEYADQGGLWFPPDQRHLVDKLVKDFREGKGSWKELCAPYIAGTSPKPEVACD